MSKVISSEYTVQKLKGKLLELLNEKAYSKITISNITERAGISRTTFYLFYDSKDELFADLCHTMLVPVYTRFYLASMNQDATEREAFHSAMQFVNTWKPAMKRIMSVRTRCGAGDSLLAESLETLFLSEDIRSDLHSKPGRYYELFAKLYASAIFSTLAWQYEHEDECGEEEFFTFVKSVKMRGLYDLLAL